MDAGAGDPWTDALTKEMRNPKPDSTRRPTKSWYPSVPGLATRPTCRAGSGTGRAALRRRRPSASSARSSWARCAAIRPSKAVTSISASTKLTSPLAR